MCNLLHTFKGIFGYNKQQTFVVGHVLNLRHIFCEIKQEDFEKIKANPNLTVIGHMTDKSDSANLVTRGDEVIPLKAQGWKAF